MIFIVPFDAYVRGAEEEEKKRSIYNSSPEVSLPVTPSLSRGRAERICVGPTPHSVSQTLHPYPVYLLVSRTYRPAIWPLCIMS